MHPYPYPPTYPYPYPPTYPAYPYPTQGGYRTAGPAPQPNCPPDRPQAPQPPRPTMRAYVLTLLVLPAILGVVAALTDTRVLVPGVLVVIGLQAWFTRGDRSLTYLDMRWRAFVTVLVINGSAWLVAWLQITLR